MKDFAIIGSEARSTTEAFGKALLELADQHPEVCALSADLAGSVKVTIMQKKYPDRVFDVGIAEQNMISMAAGLALGGLVPFAATFSVFASLRDLDQIHTDVCYQNANVKMLGSHGGTSFSQAGSTHHALEDIAALRGMANLTIICPADYIETQLATKAVYEKFGPMYIRINRGTDYDVYNTYGKRNKCEFKRVYRKNRPDTAEIFGKVGGRSAGVSTRPPRRGIHARAENGRNNGFFARRANFRKGIRIRNNLQRRHVYPFARSGFGRKVRFASDNERADAH